MSRDAIRRLGAALLDLLVPPACASCGQPGPTPLCRACDVHARPALDPPPAVLDGWSAGVPHAGDAERWMRRFKYPAPGLRGIDPAAEAVVFSWIRRAVPLLGPAPDAIVPVPLHPAAVRRRGFDPPAVLAGVVAREVGRPRLRVLQRVRDTPSQTGLGRTARRENLRGAIAARRPVPPRLWLVDDVATTGATLAACARVLRASGAREVWGCCVAFRGMSTDGPVGIS